MPSQHMQVAAKGQARLLTWSVWGVLLMFVLAAIALQGIRSTTNLRVGEVSWLRAHLAARLHMPPPWAPLLQPTRQAGSPQRRRPLLHHARSLCRSWFRYIEPSSFWPASAWGC